MDFIDWNLESFRRRLFGYQLDSSSSCRGSLQLLLAFPPRPSHGANDVGSSHDQRFPLIPLSGRRGVELDTLSSHLGVLGQAHRIGPAVHGIESRDAVDQLDNLRIGVFRLQ